MDNKRNILTNLGVEEKYWLQSFIADCHADIQVFQDLINVSVPIPDLNTDFFTLDFPFSAQEAGSAIITRPKESPIPSSIQNRMEKKIVEHPIRVDKLVGSPSSHNLPEPTRVNKLESSLPTGTQPSSSPSTKSYPITSEGQQILNNEHSISDSEYPTSNTEPSITKKQPPTSNLDPHTLNRESQASTSQRQPKVSEEQSTNNNLAKPFFSFGRLNDFAEKVALNQSATTEEEAPSKNNSHEIIDADTLEEKIPINTDQVVRLDNPIQTEPLLKDDTTIESEIEMPFQSNEQRTQERNFDTDELLEAFSEKLFREYQRYYGR